MKNKFTDLHDHLFMQLERLSDEDLKVEDLDKEIRRAKAITDISTQIIANGALIVKAHEVQAKMPGNVKMPTLLIEKGQSDDKKVLTTTSQIYK